MHRREFIAYGSAAALASVLAKAQVDQKAEAQTTVTFELHLEEIYEEMIDGEVVFALTYRDPVTRLIRPPLTVTQGARVSIKLVNKTRKPRRFAITGFSSDAFPVVAAGATGDISFAAPTAGSYIYHETTEGAVGRVLGLHGSLVVMPVDGRTAAGARTPYTNPTTAQGRLFDALGVAKRFPGERWRPELPERNLIWLFSEIDPVLNRQVERNLPVAWTTLNKTFTPQYFTINGVSGFDAAHDESVQPVGYLGEPHLIRTMNAGLATHSPHIHGNHVFVMSDTAPDTLGVVKSDNILECDTWMLKGMWRKDVLLPYIKPDEIPAAAWPPKQEQFPLAYPMHCHCEMSQTAAGGNYPQGLITHWELLGVRRGA